jgi:Rha family phage regulatory protein
LLQNRKITQRYLDSDILTVAEVFEKEHKNVKRDVQELGCSADFYTLNFERIEYRDSRGRTQEKYLMTQDGFTLLVMGYTGQRAMEFKKSTLRNLIS